MIKTACLSVGGEITTVTKGRIREKLESATSRLVGRATECAFDVTINRKVRSELPKTSVPFSTGTYCLGLVYARFPAAHLAPARYIPSGNMFLALLTRRRDPVRIPAKSGFRRLKATKARFA